MHCMTSVQMRSFFWSIFSRFRTEYLFVFSSKCGKIRSRKNSVFGHFSRSDRRPQPTRRDILAGHDSGIRLAIEKFCRHLHFTATSGGICLEFILYIWLRHFVQFNFYIYGFPLKIFIHQSVTPNIIFDNLAYALQVCGSMLA